MTRLAHPVSPPPLQEPVISLLRSANDATINDETDGRWVNGVTYQPHDNTTPVVIDPCEQTAKDTPPTPPGIVAWTPYVIKVFDVCSTNGFRGHDFKGRLDTALRVGRHKAVEKEFWGGALTQSVNTGNAWLTGAGVTDISPASTLSVKAAMQRLEQALSDCGLGGRGMIHMRPEALPPDTQVRRVGNSLYTLRDTIVVVGTGYPATGPGGTSETAGTTWLFATGMVDIRLDTENVNYYTLTADGHATGTSFSDQELITMTDRRVNTITTRAEMFALASWDQQCWFSCKANLDT